MSLIYCLGLIACSGSPSAGNSTSIGGSANTGGTNATGGSVGSGCTGNFETIQSSTGLCVAKMAPIRAPSVSDNYSIDVTEVTKGQYDSWLATHPALPASTDANCGYLTTYAEYPTGGSLYTGTDAAHHPVADVDWCDAYAYCQAVGKRLCGAIGGGSVVNFSDSYNATTSQWYRACTSGGPDTYPYGNTYQATYCDGCDYGANQTVAVGSLANCVTSTTGYAGVYDLSGNVWEWEDSCSGTGQDGVCQLRGGSFHYCSITNSSYNVACAYVFNYTRNTVFNDVGFRCCFP
jgi:formylglycine-generating enzyme required for sulfatase activity